MMDRLTYYVTHHRRLVIGVWLALTLFGMFASVKVADRWLEDFAIPGYSAYEANQRTVATLGNGEIEPFVAVLHSGGCFRRCCTRWGPASTACACCRVAWSRAATIPTAGCGTGGAAR